MPFTKINTENEHRQRIKSYCLKGNHRFFLKEIINSNGT